MGVASARVYTDPLQHAMIAAAVVAPLVPRVGTGVVRTAVAAATVIDVDHPIAARSLRLTDNISLPTRPRSHNLLTAVAAGTAVGAIGGRAHGWAAFSGLASHLLHDSGDRAAPTPMLWPFAAPRQYGRRWQLAGTVALLLGSAVLSRVLAGASSGPSAARAGGGGASSLRRTA